MKEKIAEQIKVLEEEESSMNKEIDRLLGTAGARQLAFDDIEKIHRLNFEVSRRRFALKILQRLWLESFEV